MIRVYDVYVYSGLVGGRVVRRLREVRVFGVLVYRNETEENR